MQPEKLRFCKGDWVAVGIVLLLALAVLLCYLPGYQKPAGQAQIYLNGQLIQTVDLTKDQSFTIEDRYRNEITVSSGKIFFSDSDCPGKDCVHSGSIHTSGRSLVCLPNGLEIRITSQETDVDFVVR